MFLLLIVNSCNSQSKDTKTKLKTNTESPFILNEGKPDTKTFKRLYEDKAFEISKKEIIDKISNLELLGFGGFVLNDRIYWKVSCLNSETADDEHYCFESNKSLSKYEYKKGEDFEKLFNIKILE